MPKRRGGPGRERRASVDWLLNRFHGTFHRILDRIDAGLEVGYSSASHFSQAFKREVGVLPSHYRK